MTFDRRHFLRVSSGASLALWAGAYSQSAETSGPTADLLIAGKDKRLIVHNAKSLEIETPLEILRQHPLTPPEVMFVRNNQQPSWALTLQSPEKRDWILEVTGLVEYPRSITLARL